MKVVLEMFFLIFSNTNIGFVNKKSIQKTNSAIKIFTIQKVEIIDKKELVVAVLNNKDEIFIIYILALSID